MWRWGRVRVGEEVVEVGDGSQRENGGTEESGEGGEVDVGDEGNCNESPSQTSQSQPSKAIRSLLVHM